MAHNRRILPVIGWKIIGAIAFVLSTSLPASTQQQKPFRVGWIAFGKAPPPRHFTAFRDGLRELGHVEGKTIEIDMQFADGKEETLPGIVAQMVRQKVDVIIATNNAATIAARAETSTIPILFVYGDPVLDKVVSSLAHPRGNLTGISLMAPELSGKRLDLLLQVVPKAQRIGIVHDPDAPIHSKQLSQMEPISNATGLRLEPLPVRDANLDLKSLFQRVMAAKVKGLVTLPNPTLSFHRQSFVALAEKYRLPTIYPENVFPDAGGLFSYGPSFPAIARRLAVYVDKIVKGRKTTELPVEQPLQFEMVINLKAAKQIGVNFPQSMLLQADRVVR